MVPQRAATCPPLLNAIFTASARHLSRLREYRDNGGIRYHGKHLPDLRIETAVQYHNRCIDHLVSLSDDPEEVLDENLLAAAIILRFYEEVDGKFHHCSGGPTDNYPRACTHVMTPPNSPFDRHRQ